MGQTLDKPKTEKHNEHGCGNGLRYGVASMQGWRIEMEDAHCAITELKNPLKGWSFFAVFDGHAGAKVSAHCAKHLLDSILNSQDFKMSDITESIRSGFLNLDERMRNLPELDSEKSGSTVICALISPKKIFIANCGDSRAVLCSDGELAFSTKDHKPTSPLERERIQNAGGSVMIQRINGSLAVSRALGDYQYKNVIGKGPCEQLVSAEPEVYVIERNEEKDEFLLLACDGVWDVMSSKDICDFVRYRLLLSHDLEVVANQVLDTCFYKESRDNMSIVLVTFPAAPIPSLQAKNVDKQLEELLTMEVKGLFEKYKDNISFSNLWRKLRHRCTNDTFIKLLPPGGGLEAKHKFIERLYKDEVASRSIEETTINETEISQLLGE